MLIPEESSYPATIGDICDQTGPGLGSMGGLPSFRAGWLEYVVHKYPYPYNDDVMDSLLEKTTNATFPRASLPNAFFPEKRQIDSFLGTG